MIKDIDFSGIKIAEVRDNEDPDGEGKIKVFIPDVMNTDVYRAIPTISTPWMPGFDHIQNDEPYSDVGSLQTSNYYIVRPVCYLEDNIPSWKYDHRPTDGTTIRIPRVNQKIFVFFLNDDPKKGYYLPFMPTMKGNKITPLYTESDISNLHKVHILGSYWNGNIIEMDTNEHNNLFAITVVGDPYNIDGVAEDNYRFLIDQSKKEIKLELPENIDITMYENNKIRLNNNGVTITINKGSVDIDAPVINLNGDVNISNNLHVGQNITAVGSNPNHHSHL